jgi:hypothetical protein
MKMRKVNNFISKILILIIVLISVYLLINIFKKYEGFTETPITNPSTITDPNSITNPSTITDPNSITNPSTITDPNTITNPSTITDPNTIINPSTITDPNTIINPGAFNELNRFQMLNSNLETVYNSTVDISDNLYKVSNNINYKLNDISDNMFSDYDASRNFYNSSGNMISQILTKLNDLTLKIDTTANLKCVANFGTKIGEKLSGGKGVLTDTKYICPEEMPNCAGMLCDEKYGVCTK